VSRQQRILYLGQQPAWSGWLHGKGYHFLFLESAALPMPVDMAIVDLKTPEAESFLLPSLDQIPPLILLHESGKRAGALLAIRAGACDYLLKPFSPSELLTAIDEGLRRPARLQRSTQDLRCLAEKLAGSPARCGALPRVSLARQEALHAFFLLLRAQALTRATSWHLWERLMLLEKIYLHGICHPVPDDPAAYLLMTLDILAGHSSPRLSPMAETAAIRFLDRVEQREIDEPLFLLAAALQLSSSDLPLGFQTRYDACWT